MSSFDDWLRQLSAAQKGPWTISVQRGRAFYYLVRLPGDWTGAVMEGQVRAAPDAGGLPLCQFEITGPAVDAEYSTFILQLPEGYGANSTGALPAAPAGDGYIELPYDLTLTPSGGAADILFGGSFIVFGAITHD